jgi:hypothetical protein
LAAWTRRSFIWRRARTNPKGTAKEKNTLTLVAINVAIAYLCTTNNIPNAIITEIKTDKAKSPKAFMLFLAELECCGHYGVFYFKRYNLYC